MECVNVLRFVVESAKQRASYGLKKKRLQNPLALFDENLKLMQLCVSPYVVRNECSWLLT